MDDSDSEVMLLMLVADDIDGGLRKRERDDLAPRVALAAIARDSPARRPARLADAGRRARDERPFARQRLELRRRAGGEERVEALRRHERGGGGGARGEQQERERGPEYRHPKRRGDGRGVVRK